METRGADRKQGQTDIGLTTIVARDEAVIFTEIDDVIIMMDVDEGRYYELDEVGARIWAVIESGASVAAICDALREEYEVAADVCQRDVLDFVTEAQHRGVIRVLEVSGEAKTPPR